MRVVSLFVRVPAAAALLSLALAGPAREALADDAAPPLHLQMMSPDAAVACYSDAAGVTWRVQCDDTQKRCLYAPNAELDAEGKPVRPLERARYCTSTGEVLDREAFAARGFELVRALADAPHGWMRDERGRVFQVEFDLKRRMYVGVSYAPRWQQDAAELGRLAVDVGLLSYERSAGASRHRFRFVEGEIFLDPFSGRLVLLHYDLSRRYDNPLIRITTFFGKPRRSDLSFNLGTWFEGGDIELHSSELGDEVLIRYATLHGTIDLWQSPDLYSTVRLRGGLGWESTTPEGDEDPRPAFTPGAALEADLTLDRKGFHHIGATVSYEHPRYFERHPRLGKSSQRIEADVSYELIVLAINDQPLSLFVSAGASKRDDLEVMPSTWSARAKAGLRFSLWAPARPR
ncbi:hypothetical protein [Haliangium sp.]|uniref:hypothetical protein n=1 Tax=Haliangium sp. TaxID=2663208 RepID=UPI003D138085